MNEGEDVRAACHQAQLFTTDSQPAGSSMDSQATQEASWTSKSCLKQKPQLCARSRRSNLLKTGLFLATSTLLTVTVSADNHGGMSNTFELSQEQMLTPSPL